MLLDKDTPILHMVIEHMDEMIGEYENLFYVYNSVPISEELENILLAEQEAMGSFQSPFPTFGFKYHEYWLKYYEMENVYDLLWKGIQHLLVDTNS